MRTKGDRKQGIVQDLVDRLQALQIRFEAIETSVKLDSNLGRLKLSGVRFMEISEGIFRLNIGVRPVSIVVQRLA